VKAIEKQSYRIQSEILSSLGIDYLKQFPELDEYNRVEAADGLLRALCVVTNGTDRHQEIPTLRNYIEQRYGKKDTWQKHLYVYDKSRD